MKRTRSGIHKRPYYMVIVSITVIWSFLSSAVAGAARAGGFEVHMLRPLASQERPKGKGIDGLFPGGGSSVFGELSHGNIIEEISGVSGKTMPEMAKDAWDQTIYLLNEISEKINMHKERNDPALVEEAAAIMREHFPYDYERLQEMTYNPMSGNYMGDNQAAKIEFFLEDTSVEYLTEYLFRMKISKCIEPLNLGLSDVNPKPYDLEAPEKAKEAGEIGILARCLYELSGDGSINQKLRNFLTQAPCASVFIGARPASWIDDPPYVPGLEADLNDFVKRFNNLIRLYSPDTKAVYGITPVPGSRSYILYEQNAVIGELDLAKDAMTPNGEAFLDAGTKALLGLPASEASEKLILKLLKSGMDHRIGALLGYGIDNAARYARYQKLMFGIPTSLVERVNIGSIKILSQAEYLYRFGMLSPTDKEIVDRFMFQELRKIQTNESFKFIQGLKGPEVPISWITFNTEETAYLKGRHEAYLKHAGAAWQRLEAESLRGQMNGLKQVQNTLDNI